MARILIVEDDSNIRKLLSANLIARGYEVIEAANGRQGLTFLQEASPAMLLLDIKLPDMSGWELLRMITSDSAYPQIPVIVITASLGSASIDHSLFKNLRKVLTKPISVEDLTHAVREALI